MQGYQINNYLLYSSFIVSLSFFQFMGASGILLVSLHMGNLSYLDSAQHGYVSECRSRQYLKKFTCFFYLK